MFFLTPPTLIWQLRFAQWSLLTRRLFQTSCLQPNQLQKKKKNEKWGKLTWIYVLTLMFSMKVMKLGEAPRTCWDESLQIMGCSRTRLCLCEFVCGHQLTDVLLQRQPQEFLEPQLSMSIKKNILQKKKKIYNFMWKKGKRNSMLILKL